MKRLRKRIKSWHVGLTGALLALVSTLSGGGYLVYLEFRVTEQSEKAEDLREQNRRSWESHKLSDERARAAELLAHMTLAGLQSPFALQKISDELKGAVLAMEAAANESVTDQPSPEIENSMTKIRAGNLEGYSELRQRIESLRLAAISKYQMRHDQASQLEQSVEKIKPLRRLIYWLQLSLNILALILVLLKDLPIWADSETPAGREADIANEGAASLPARPPAGDSTTTS